eukprot:jgi/Psemu1/319304/estExt_fgenesh1_pm.C_2010003
MSSKPKETDEVSVVDAASGGYRVVVESCPSASSSSVDEGYTTRRIVGTYITEDDAIRAAKRERSSNAVFESWADDFFGDQPPPYKSASLDCSEDVCIFIENLTASNNGKGNSSSKRARSSTGTTTSKKKTKSGAQKTHPYPVGTKISKKFDGVFYSGEIVSYDSQTKYYKVKYEDGDQEDMIERQIKWYLVAAEAPMPAKERKFGAVKRSKKAILANIDKDRFLRNPCCVFGGKQYPAEDYANTGRGPPEYSYYYLMQRLSDRNYAMRGLCIDGDGVQYTTFKKESLLYKLVAFLPETNLNHHSKNPTILDACHLDVIEPHTGECLLTKANLLEAVTPETECIFLNGFQNGGPSRRHSQKVDPKVVVTMIDVCKDNLKCFSLTECIVSNEILNALASCKQLRGLTLYTTQPCSEASGVTRANDDGLAAIIRECTDLRWLYVVECGFFRDNSWNALESPGACPNLEVLWVTSQKRHHVCYGDHNVVRRALDKRAGTLKMCMVNWDRNLTSRYIIGGAKETDRLNGDNRPPSEIMTTNKRDDC